MRTDCHSTMLDHVFQLAPFCVPARVVLGDMIRHNYHSVPGVFLIQVLDRAAIYDQQILGLFQDVCQQNMDYFINVVILLGAHILHPALVHSWIRNRDQVKLELYEPLPELKYTAPRNYFSDGMSPFVPFWIQLGRTYDIP